MCAVSAVSDDWIKRQGVPSWFLNPAPTPTREEFERLRKEVEDLRNLLEAAKAEDIKNNEPDCDHADKTEILERLAELVGISLKEFFSGSQTSRTKSA